MGVLLLLVALLVALGAGAPCTAKTCAEVSVAFEAYGDVRVSDAKVLVNGKVWLETNARLAKSNFQFVEPGTVEISAANVPGHTVTRVSCLDWTAKSNRNAVTESTSGALSIKPKAGQKLQCTVRVFGKEPTLLKRQGGINADVSIVKGGSNTSEVGSTFLYQFVLAVTNAGKDTAFNLVVNDPVDPRFTIRSIIAPTLSDGTVITCPDPFPNGTYTNNITCTFPSLAVNLTATILLQYTAPATISLGDSVVVNNVATVSSSTPDNDLPNNVNTHQVLLTVIADLRVQITGTQRVTAGIQDTVFYTMVVCNNGLSNAIAVTANWTIPAEFSIINSPVPLGLNDQPVTNPTFGNCTNVGNQIYCTRPGLNNGECQKYRVGIVVPSTVAGPFGATVFENATVGSAIPDLDLGNNVGSLSILIVVQADLRITKSGPTRVLAGGNSNFDIIVTNAGPSQAYGVVVTDFFPSSPGRTLILNSTGWTISQGTCTVTGQLLNCSLGNVAVSEPGNFNVRINAPYYTSPSITPTIFAFDSPDSANPIINNATVTSISQDPKLSDNTDPAPVDVYAIADVWIQKSCSPGPFISGTTQSTTFTLTAGNQGVSTAIGVNISDVIPQQFVPGSIVSQSGATCQLVGATLTCIANGPLLPLGQQAQITVTVSVTPVSGLTSDVNVTNVAFISTTTNENNQTQNNVAQCTTLIRPPPDITIQKAAPGSILVDTAGGVVFNYTITIINNGPTNGDQVRLNDLIPAQFVPNLSQTTITGGNGGLTFAANCGAQSSGNNLICNFGSFNFGNPNIVVTVPFTVPAGTPAQTVENCAVVLAALDLNPNNNRACAQTALSVGAELVVSKRTLALCAGNSGSYTIDVSNLGPAPAQNVVLRDPLQAPQVINGAPSTVIQLPATPRPDLSCAFDVNSVLTCSLGTINAGVTLRVVFGYYIPSSVRATTVSNTVTVNTTTFQLNTTNDSFTYVNTISECSDMAITKTGPASVVAGTSSENNVPYQYSFAVTNNGPSDAANVTVSDVLPSDLVPSAAVATGGGSCQVSGQSVTCSWSGLWRSPVNPGPARNETVTVFFSVRATAPRSTVQNCAIVSTTTVDTVAANNISCVLTNIQTVADVAVTKTGPNGCIIAGQGFGTYVVTVNNFGPSVAYTVSLTDDVPSPFLLQGSLSVTGSGVVGNPCSAVGNVISCNFGNLAPSTSGPAQITIVYNVSASSNTPPQTGIVNTATVSSQCSPSAVLPCSPNSQDPVASNNVATFTSCIGAIADLQIVKNCNPGPIVSGKPGPYFFNISVTNAGPSTAFQVVLTDQVPATLQVLSIVSSTGGFVCDPVSQNLITCRASSLTVGSSGTVTVAFRPISGITVDTTALNVASVSSATSDPTVPNTASCSTLIVPPPNLVIDKRGVGSILVDLDSTVYNYTITITNNGPTDAEDVRFADTVPSTFVVDQSLITVSGGAGGLSYATNCAAFSSGNYVSCAFGTLPVNPSTNVSNPIVIVIGFRVPSTTLATSVLNCATVNATLESNTNDNRACWLTTLTNGANMKVTKSTSSICAGQNGSYAITVFNAGPAPARTAHVYDQVPAPLVPIQVTSVVKNGIVNLPTSSCSFNGTNFLFCTLGDMQVNDQIVIVFTYSIPSTFRGGLVSNTVTANSSTVDLELSSNNFTETTQFNVCVNLFANKTGPAVVIPGASDPSYYYVLTVTNAGPSAADSVTMYDILPQYLRATSYTATGGGSCLISTSGTGLSQINCNWAGQLYLPGRSDTVTVFFTVDPSAPEQVITNCVNVAAAAGQDVNPADNVACFQSRVTPRADVAVTKTGPSNCVEAGRGTAQYQIVVRNNGPSYAYNVQLSDTVPVPFVFTQGSLSVTGASGTPCVYNSATSTIACNFGNMLTTDVFFVNYAATVPAAASSTTGVVNTATVSSGCSVPLNCVTNSADLVPSNNQANFTSNVCASADLAIAKDVSAGPLVAGNGVVNTFGLTVTNYGPAVAYNVTVSDFGYTGGVISSISSARGICSLSTLSCFYPSFGLQTDVITLTFTIPASVPCGVYTNTANVSSAVTFDPFLGNNTATISLNQLAQHDLSILKQGQAQVIEGGLAGQFYVIFHNNGPSDATNVQFLDNVPAPLTVQSVTNNSTNSSACRANGQVISCQFAVVPVGTIYMVNYTYTVAPDAPLPPVDPVTGKRLVTNTACVNSINMPACQTELVPANNCDSFRTEVLCVADLAITKSDGQSVILAGDGTVYTFTMNVTNKGGPSFARTVVVTDRWPGDQYTAQGVPVATSGGVCTWAGPNAFVCTLPELAPNQTVTITISYTVAASVPPQYVTNFVSVQGSCIDQDLSNNNASDTNQIINRVDLAIVKDDCATNIIAGGLPNTFTFTVTNKGPSNGVNVVVADYLPIQYKPLDLVPVGQLQPSSCTFNSTYFACTYPSFPVGQIALLTLSYHVEADVLPQYVTNCANVTNAVTDSNLADNEDCDTNEVCTRADLAITKSVTPGTPNKDCILAGDLSTSVYNVTVVNNGPSWARNVVVFEAFPAGITLSSVPSVCQNTPVGSKNYTCAVGDLIVGQKVSFFFGFTVSSSTPAGIITNFASVTSSTVDPDKCNNNVTLASLVCVESDLSVTKDDGVTVVTAGAPVVLRYNITGYNAGPSDAVDVVLDDVWPNPMAGFTLLEIRGAQSCTRSATGFVCRIGNLTVGQKYSICVLYSVDACAMACQACNAVQISSDSPDPNPGNNLAVDCNEVRTEADLSVNKTDGRTTVVAGTGEIITYTVVVSNAGPSCAQKVSLVDHFPKQVYQIPGSVVIVSGSGSCIVEGPGPNFQDFSCNLLTLRPGQSVTVVAQYTVPANITTCSIRNTATVSSVTFDPRVCNNVATDVDALLEQALLQVNKTATTSAIVIGDVRNQTFIITVQNLGPSVARDVVLTDIWPFALCQYREGITTTQGVATSTGGDIIVNIGDIQVGPQYTVTVRVPFNLCDKAVPGIVTNNATAFSPTDTTCREASFPITILPGVTKKKEAAVEKAAPSALERMLRNNNNIVYEMPSAAPAKHHNMNFDASLSPVNVAVKVSGTFTIEVRNTNREPVRIVEVKIVGINRQGHQVTIDATKTSKDAVVSTTCDTFADRKLPASWSQKCTVELAEPLQSTYVVVGGTSRKSDGIHPVMGSSNQ